jgi:anti-repressor protein
LLTVSNKRHKLDKVMIDKTELRLADTFNFEGSDIQVFWEGEDPWFLAHEICAVLGYKNPRNAVKRHLSEKDVSKRYTLSVGGRQSMTYINEPGLYDLARRSKMPIADKFYHKVTHEVLPTIRKKGVFIDGGKIIDFSKVDMSASNDVARMLMQAGSTIMELNKKVEDMIPMYDFGNELKSTDNLFTATEVAKELGVSAQCLNRFLHDKKIIFKHRGCWVPYTNYDGADYFKKVNTTIIKTDSGESFQRHSLKITAKGQELIHRLWREHKAKLLSGKPLELDLKTA